MHKYDDEFWHKMSLDPDAHAFSPYWNVTTRLKLSLKLRELNLKRFYNKSKKELPKYL